MNSALITVEILLVVVTPLLFLYLKGSWPLRVIVPCLLTIPLLWYFTYAPLHELSHAAGTYFVGGKVTSIKIIPSFWLGEFGRAWINSEGVVEPWRQLITTLSPYLFDGLCIAAGLHLLRHSRLRNAFLIGFLFMLLFLRPAFDFVCETAGFLSGDKGDFYHLDMILGDLVTWAFMVTSLAVSFLSVFVVLRRFLGFPETFSASADLAGRTPT